MMTTMIVPKFANGAAAVRQPGEYSLVAPHDSIPEIFAGDYNDIAGDYYDCSRHMTCANFRAASQVVIDNWLARLAPENCRMVEVGAGDSLAAHWLYRERGTTADLLITDSSPRMLRHSFGWQAHGAKLRVARAERLPVAGGSIDVVVASLGDPYNHRPFWVEMRRVLKDKGALLFTTPSHVWAERYRRSEGFGTMQSALFRREAGYLSIPSFIPREEAQRCLISSCGLTVREVSQVNVSRIAQFGLSQKLACLLADDECVVTGYLVSKLPSQDMLSPAPSRGGLVRTRQERTRELAV